MFMIVVEVVVFRSSVFLGSSYCLPQLLLQELCISSKAPLVCHRLSVLADCGVYLCLHLVHI